VSQVRILPRAHTAEDPARTTKAQVIRLRAEVLGLRLSAARIMQPKRPCQICARSSDLVFVVLLLGALLLPLGRLRCLSLGALDLLIHVIGDDFVPAVRQMLVGHRRAHGRVPHEVHRLTLAFNLPPPSWRGGLRALVRV
jgi:hypothetical protein